MPFIYEDCLRSLLREGHIDTKHNILVACGGLFDAETFARLGFVDVTISNLDGSALGEIRQFPTRCLDVEALMMPDANVDWAVVHSGLHHCASPHKALTELLRVARKGVLVVEARDSLLSRLAGAIGLGSDYELEAVALEGGRTGGLRNGPIPNYIYRWTEREVRKTVEAAKPERVNDLRFFYGLQLPDQRLSMASRPKRLVAATAGRTLQIAQRLFPRLGNQFAFAVLNTGRLKPWIGEGQLRADYGLAFDPGRYDIAA